MYREDWLVILYQFSRYRDEKIFGIRFGNHWQEMELNFSKKSSIRTINALESDLYGIWNENWN